MWKLRCLKWAKSDGYAPKTMTYERTLVREAVVRNFIFGVEWSYSPDDGLGAVCQDVNVELVLRLQGPLVCHNGIAVHHSSIEEPHAACVLLLT